MSNSKKRGLQHGLSEIINPPISLEEKSRYTAQLLNKVAPKTDSNVTSDIKSPVTLSHQTESINTGHKVTSEVVSPVFNRESESQSQSESQTELKTDHRSDGDLDLITDQQIDQKSDQDKTGDIMSTGDIVTSDIKSPVLKSHRSTGAIKSPVTESHPFTDPDKNFTKVPNYIFDKLMAVLEPGAFKVYMRLFRLSHGFRKTQCLVGYSALSESCNITARHIKRIIPELEMMGLIKVVATHNSGQLKGTVYEVYAGDNMTPVTKEHAGHKDTSDTKSPNKDLDDHDDLKKKDHHQNETMRIYQSITGNGWSKSDQTAYVKIKGCSLDAIEQGIRVVTARAASRPGSLAYFIKEILAIANPAPASRAQRRRELQQIIDRVRLAHTGQANYSMADFSADVKDMCAREGVVFDHAIFNEIVS